MARHNLSSVEIVKTIKTLNVRKMTQTSSDHKIADVKQTDTGNIGRNNTFRMKSEIDDTCNITISCLDRDDFGYYCHGYSSI